MTDNSRYALRGVSSGKEEVHKAISNIDKGLFPKAFCKIVPDLLSGSKDHCVVLVLRQARRQQFTILRSSSRTLTTRSSAYRLS